MSNTPKRPANMGGIAKSVEHAEICKLLTAMYEEKNAHYGDSYTLLRFEYPMSICWRLTDKLNRLKTLYRYGDVSYEDNINDTLMDIANYAIMELIERGGEWNDNHSTPLPYL